MDKVFAMKRMEDLFTVCEMAKDFYHSCLTRTTYGKEARAYLAERGVNEDVIAKYQLGFAPPAWNKLTTALNSRGYTNDLLIEAGLSANNSAGTMVFDRFRSRITFPIRDAHGRVIGFGGRATDGNEVKYLNTPETPLFTKRHVLYGFEKALSAIRATGVVIVVEGFMDLIGAQGVLLNTVASLGTAFTPEQARRLARYANQIYFAYDSDAAGQNATIRALTTVKDMGFQVRMVDIPDGKDPDEFIRKHGSEAFQGIVAKARELAQDSAWAVG